MLREAVPVLVGGEGHDAWPRLGPDSPTWKFYGDHRTAFFGFQRTAGVENCIEQLAQGVLDHSVVFSDTLGRARRTAPLLMHAVYSDDPQAWGRKVRDFHKPIKGTVSDGSRYHALNPQAGPADSVRAAQRTHPAGRGGHFAPRMQVVCQLEWNAKKDKRFQRLAATVQALNPLINRLPLSVVYLPSAARAWRRVGVDPRGLHNGARGVERRVTRCGTLCAVS